MTRADHLLHPHRLPVRDRHGQYLPGISGLPYHLAGYQDGRVVSEDPGPGRLGDTDVRLGGFDRDMHRVVLPGSVVDWERGDARRSPGSGKRRHSGPGHRLRRAPPARPTSRAA